MIKIIAKNLLTAVLSLLTLGETCLALPLSPGDRLNIFIREGQGFSGAYQVDVDGSIELPYLRPLSVTGLETLQVEQLLKDALVKAKIFQPKFIQVSVKVIQWSPIEVMVSGATFEPGRVLLNQLATAEETDTTPQVSGDKPKARYLTSAIRAAGGITPDADLTQVRLLRREIETVIDLSGVFTGQLVNDVPLIAGDRIIVPKAERINNDLVRPSQITPAGVKVYLSNLSVPASSNSQAAISKDATSFAYGSRFSQAVIAANCAGGTQTTNASRRAVLIRVDRFIGQTQYLDRSIEELLRESTDDKNNPFLMPNDGVACYDSAVSNLRDVANTLGEIFQPFSLLWKLLF